MRVREVDVPSLLGSSPQDGALGPYLPRDVDAQLDKCLAEPGVVVMASGGWSGVRRTVYEALMRNHSEATLVVDGVPESDLDTQPSSDATILCLDRTLPHGRSPDALVLEAAVRWFDPRHHHWIVAIARTQSEAMTEVESILAPLRPTMIPISATLTVRERECFQRLYPNVNVTPRTVAELDAMVLDPTTGEPTTWGWSVAAYRPDTDRGADLLGVSGDVRMLANLVASRQVEPPLSIGLFGKWGSGKSFFMRQMRDRVKTLAQETHEAEQTAGQRGRAVSSYCGSVRQIDFNAWHYTEANLWASLGVHIFDSLAAESSEDDLERQANELADIRRQEQSLTGQLSAVRMERMLRAAQQKRRSPVAGVWRDALREDDLRWIAAELGVENPHAVELLRFKREAGDLGAEARMCWKRFRHDPVPWVAFLAALAVVATLFLTTGWSPWSGLSTLVAVIAPVTAGVTRVKSALTRIRVATERIENPTATDHTLADLDRTAEHLERSIAELAASTDATEFARSRHASQDYRQHLGLVSLFRKDLETFATMLAAERDRSGGAHGIERIILYVDDLDRCPPKTVIEVLEAVHLLLALPVFVVVIGVDVDWLDTAIRTYYADMITNGTTQPADSLARNYLEKIFQVPFALARMDKSAFSGLVRGLTAAESVIPLSSAPAPQRTPALTEDHLANAPVGADIRSRLAPDAPYTALRPPQLDITDNETEFLATLAPLVTSPRVAKRLVNLYRLVRARLADHELNAFLAPDETEAPYRGLLILLAIQVGHGDSATALYRSLECASAPTTWSELVPDDDTVLAVTLRRLSAGAVWSRPPEALHIYRQWLPLVRRFSFGPGTVAAS